MTEGQKMSLMIPVDDEIQLRFVQQRHAEELAAVIDANRVHLACWLPWATADYNVDGVRAWIDMVTQSFGERKELALSIVNNGTLVGGIGWSNWQHVNNTAWGMTAYSADIGYWLAAGAEGQGIVTRSTRALVDYGFHEVGLNRITIRAEPENEGSWAVPERLGFQYEGTQRHVCYWKDRWVDHRCYAMLDEEWG
jgi:ribosomal-protein-serine acetyltransferase